MAKLSALAPSLMSYKKLRIKKQFTRFDDRLANDGYEKFCV